MVGLCNVIITLCPAGDLFASETIVSVNIAVEKPVRNIHSLYLFDPVAVYKIRGKQGAALAECLELLNCLLLAHLEGNNIIGTEHTVKLVVHYKGIATVGAVCGAKALVACDLCSAGRAGICADVAVHINSSITVVAPLHISA